MSRQHIWSCKEAGGFLPTPEACPHLNITGVSWFGALCGSLFKDRPNITVRYVSGAPIQEVSEFKLLLHDCGIHAASVRQDNIRSCTTDKPKHVTERIGSQTERELVRIWPGVATSNKESTMSEDIDLISLENIQEQMDGCEGALQVAGAGMILIDTMKLISLCEAGIAAHKLKQRNEELEAVLSKLDGMPFDIEDL